MKIAVFGDSYAADCDWDFNHYPGWVERLRRLKPDWHIDNYAQHGSSFWYSWSLWREHHISYDRVIVFVTQWDRQSFYTGDPKPWAYCHVPNINQLEHNIRARSPKFKPYQRAFQALYDYWLLVNQEQQHKELHDLMLANIQQLAPETLIVPCFNWENSRLASPSQTTLQDISNRDIPPELAQDITQFYQQYACQRTNHMNEPNLDLMALTMRTWALTGQLDWDSQPWGEDTQRPFDYYFKRI